jgi:hypothetical protein
LIQHFDTSHFETFRRATADYSVNWPYADEDIFLSDPTKDRVQLNPVFVAHIRNKNNWTFNPAIKELFPYLTSCPVWSTSRKMSNSTI